MTNINDIQKDSINNFNKNLIYFKDNYQDVYKRVIEFKILWESNKIDTRYSLEYLEDNFDLLNIKTKQYFYEKNLTGYNKTVEDTLDFSSIRNTIHNTPFEIFEKKYKQKYDILPDTQKAVDTSSKLLKNLELKKDKIFKKIDKFIVIGTLLGTHLDTIHNKLNSQSYFIVEPDIEIFYLSLFVTKYYEFAADRYKMYSIMDSKEILLQKLHSFYMQDFHKNHSLKYYLASESYSYLFDTISVSLGRLENLSFPYPSYFKALKRTMSHIMKKNNILNVKDELSFFDNKPVLIVSPGPSLLKNMKWLKKYSNRFVIVCYSQSLKRLLSEGILPDIITIVDSSKKLYKDFKGIENNLFKKTILLANVNVHKKILDLFYNDNLFLYEKEFLVKPKTSEYIFGATVGETTYQICLMLNAKRIYLLGTDMSIDSLTGRTHDAMHSYRSNKKLNVKNKVSYRENVKVNQDEELLIVEGNFESEVYTTVFYTRLIAHYNMITLKYKKDGQKVFNLSDGAKLNGITPYSEIKEFKKLKHIKKDELHEKLIKKFKKKSSNKFTVCEKKLISNEIVLLKDIEKKFKNVFLNKNCYIDFDRNMVSIMKEILVISEDNDYSVIRRKIFLNYFSINANLIYYVLNSNDTFDYNVIFNSFVIELKKLLKAYIKILKQVKI